MTAPYSPSQNSVAERMNHILEELACVMLMGVTLPEFLWELAISHAAYLRNLSYMTALPTATPYQAWHGQKPNVLHLRKFGAPVWILLQGQNVQCKMLPKSQYRAYVGMDEGAKAIKYYNAAMRNVLTLRNYHFLEPSEPSPPEDIVVDMCDDQGEHAPPHEGENKDKSMRKSNAIIPMKRPAENEINTREPQKAQGVQVREDINTREPHKTHEVQINYKYLNDPFLDEEEAGITSVMKEEVFAVIPDNEC